MRTIILAGYRGKLGSEVLKRLTSIRNYNTIPYTNDKDIFGADVFLNCAGVVTFGSIVDTNDDEYLKLIESNINMPWRVAKSFILNGGKHIINIGSTRSISVAPDKAAYSMSKFALRALTQSINLDYNPRVKASLICPGNFTNGPLSIESIVDAIEFVIEHPDVKELIIGGQI